MPNPWIADLLSWLIMADPMEEIPPWVSKSFAGAYYGDRGKRGVGPFAQFQKEYGIAQRGQTMTSPMTNPLWQASAEEFILPQIFGLGDIVGKMEAEVPGTAETWGSIMAGAPEEVWDFPFETRPGEIFYPNLPTEVVSPEVTQEKERAEMGRDWLLKVLAPLVEEGFSPEGFKEYFGTFGQGAEETAFPGLYPPTKEKPPKPTETEKTRQRKIKYLIGQGMSQQEAEDYLTQRGIYGEATEPKRMTAASYRSQASSLEAQAGKSTDKTEIKALFERAKILREEANKLFRQEQQRAGMIPSIPSLPARVTPAEDVLAPILGIPAEKETTGVTPEGMLPEDEFIRQAKGKGIDWEAVKGDHPEWDFDYIFEQLGF